MKDADAKRLMIDCFMAGVRAVHPESCLQSHLPKAPQRGKIILLAGGKAAGAMLKVAVQHYLKSIDKERISGLAVHHHDADWPLFHMEQIRAGHPLPDKNSQKGALRALELAGAAGQDDLVVVLLSGGASSLWSAPIDGITLSDKRDLTAQLLRSGAKIDEINIVRKHLSKIKGGRLALAARPARVVTLAISDVVGDHPAIIGSGVTSGDRSCLGDVRHVLDRYNLQVGVNMEAAFNDPANEPPTKEDERLSNSSWHCIASGATALAGATSLLEAKGYRVINLGDLIEGEARRVAIEHARLAREQKQGGQPVAVLSGGEMTVTMRGEGIGGPNQEYALALAIALDGTQNICALAADTDGCDGGTGQTSDPAGAFVFPSTLRRAGVQKLNPATFLADNNSGGFFKRLDDLLVTGPTYTNVNDFRLVLINNK